MPKITIVRQGGQVTFSPSPMQIAEGDMVFWLNDDNQEHRIDLVGELLLPGTTSSSVLITGDRPYSCTLHPGETGFITAQDVNALLMATGAIRVQPDKAKKAKAKKAKAKKAKAKKAKAKKAKAKKAAPKKPRVRTKPTRKKGDLRGRRTSRKKQRRSRAKKGR
jgi:hypothetical protein